MKDYQTLLLSGGGKRLSSNTNIVKKLTNKNINGKIKKHINKKDCFKKFTSFLYNSECSINLFKAISSTKNI